MNPVFKTKCLGVLMLLMFLSFIAEAGRFYVIIGTFTEEAGAREFATGLRGHFSKASFTHDPERDLYHVYVLETNHREEAEDFRHYLQYENGFPDAWILSDINWGGSPSENNIPTDNGATLELYTGGAVLLSSADNSYISIIKSQPQIPESLPGASEMGLTFIPKTFRGVTISAKVSLMDAKGNAISTFKTGEVVSFSGRQPEQVLRLVCEAPGYNTETRIVALNKLGQMRGVAQNEAGLWAIRFKMTKRNVNKMDLFYRDAFYSDAAVLQPKTKKRLAVLIAMMQANSGLRAEINSHCDAGPKREIMLPRNGSYFDLSDATGKTASDKQLTRYRTETLREYLIEQGIDSKRISVMGWGSLDMLVRDGAGDTGVNERLEIELSGE